MKTRTIVALGATIVATMATTASLPASASTPSCGWERTGARYLSVSGPAGGVITVNGHRKGRLVLVDGDTYNESSPWSGLRTNVHLKHKHQRVTVRVDGRTCEQS